MPSDRSAPPAAAAIASAAGPPVVRSAWLPWLAAALSLLPLVLLYSSFRTLFWFGDEWDQIDQIEVHGFAAWLWMPFAENVVPVFKLVWGAAVHAFDGSYAGMVWLLWLAHAANTLVLGRVLLAAGCSVAATGFVLVVFGLSATNIETLAWSVQLSPVLSVLFMLLAFDWLLRVARDGSASPLRVYAVPLLLSAASAFSFSRGVLTGPALALFCLLAMLAAPRREWPVRFAGAASLVLPSLVAAALIMVYASGNHRDLAVAGDRFANAALYAVAYLALNPGYQSFGLTEGSVATGLWLGALKLAVVVAGLAWANPTQRRLLLALLAFDLLNAALMGLGRHHTGLGTTAGSRYQYVSLLCTLPFLGVVLARAFALLPSRRAAQGVFVAATLLVGAQLLFAWSKAIGPWVSWRGIEPRRVLLQAPDPPAQGAVPGLPSMTTERAKALTAEYGLH